METQPISAEDDNRRRAPRVRTLKGGKIIFAKGFSVFDCIIRNLSDTGAMLTLGDTLGIPSHFDLAMDSAKLRRACTVRWRSQKAIGVSFDDVSPLAA